MAASRLFLNKHVNSENKGLILGSIGIFIFALTLPAARYSAPYLDPVFIGLGRACCVAPVAIMLLFINKTPIPTAHQFKQLIVVAFGTVFAFPVLTAIAM